MQITPKEPEKTEPARRPQALTAASINQKEDPVEESRSRARTTEKSESDVEQEAKDAYSKVLARVIKNAPAGSIVIVKSESDSTFVLRVRDDVDVKVRANCQMPKWRIPELLDPNNQAHAEKLNR